MIVVAVALESEAQIPMPVLPEMTLPVMVVFSPPSPTWTPIPLGTAPVPAAFVPIRFPWTKLLVELLVSSTPTPPVALELPEMTFRSASVGPPTTTFVAELR